MAVDTALFVLGLDKVFIPTPVANFNFRTNTGSIGGVTKTFAQMFQKFSGADPVIVPGQGLQVVSTTDTNSECLIKSTAGLFATVTREFVGVVEFTTSTTGNPLVNDMLVSISSTDDPDFNEGWAWNYQSELPYNWDKIDDFSGGSYADIQPLAAPYQGHYKTAYMFCEEVLAASTNGAASRVPVGTPQANAAANMLLINIRARSIDNVATTTVTLNSITFYAELTPDALPALSAL